MSACPAPARSLGPLAAAAGAAIASTTVHVSTASRRIGGTLRAQLANRDGHPRGRAAAALVVGDVDVPDPGRAAAVQRSALGVDRALADRAQEGGAVGHAGHELAL